MTLSKKAKFGLRILFVGFLVILMLISWVVLQAAKERADLGVQFIAGPRAGRSVSFQGKLKNLSNKTVGLSQSVEAYLGRADGEQGTSLLLDAGRWESAQPTSLKPGDEISFTFDIPANYPRFRFRTIYRWEGSRTTKWAAKIVRKLPINWLPVAMKTWIYQHGLWTGIYEMEFTAPWSAITVTNLKYEGRGHIPGNILDLELK